MTVSPMESDLQRVGIERSKSQWDLARHKITKALELTRTASSVRASDGTVYSPVLCAQVLLALQESVLSSASEDAIRRFTLKHPWAAVTLGYESVINLCWKVNHDSALLELAEELARMQEPHMAVLLLQTD